MALEVTCFLHPVRGTAIPGPGAPVPVGDGGWGLSAQPLTWGSGENTGCQQEGPIQGPSLVLPDP